MLFLHNNIAGWASIPIYTFSNYTSPHLHESALRSAYEPDSFHQL